MAISQGRREHWERVYRERSDAELSWFQRESSMTLTLIDSLGSSPRRAIDVGGGQSSLAGALLSRGVEEVTVLDISESALTRARQRVGAAVASRITWVTGDILDSLTLTPCELWHDRAVFHFLTEAADRARYAEVAAKTVVPGGHAIIATFAPAGPNKCSGLPVQRHDANTLAAAFEPAFRRVGSREESHMTPWGKVQAFTYVVLQRI